MQTENSSSAASAEGSERRGGAGSAAEQALARRRVLLKGLGKGSAVVAAMVPIQTLAVPVLAGGRLCTISGAMSAVHSVAPGMAEECAGYRPSHFLADGSNWPPQVTPRTHTTPFNVIFANGGTLSGPADPINVVVASGLPDAVWATAYLNALANVSNYPYTDVDVVAFYNSTDLTLRMNAFSFFQTYMQTLP